MGCVSSNLLNHDDEFPHLVGTSALGHHIVSLTSTTYGLLTLDPPPPTPPSRFTFGSIFPSPLSDPRPPRQPEPEVINSWELMAGLDADSFRLDKQNSNSNPNRRLNLDRFERICPPKGENRVVIYTTSLRGVRRTFEACNEVRAAMESLGVAICERDVSMDSGFREELRELLRGKERGEMVPPRVFVKGRYIGGAEEVMKVAEEGLMGEILEGLPRKKVGDVCVGCGDMRFLPCFRCHGSCRVVMVVKKMKKEESDGKQGRSSVVVRCPDCNENGLVLCPICC